MAGECEKELADERESRAALIDVLQETTDRELRQKARADVLEKKLAEAAVTISGLAYHASRYEDDREYNAELVRERDAEIERLRASAFGAESRRLLEQALPYLRHKNRCDWTADGTAGPSCQCGLVGMEQAIRAHLAGKEGSRG